MLFTFEVAPNKFPLICVICITFELCRIMLYQAHFNHAMPALSSHSALLYSVLWVGLCIVGEFTLNVFPLNGYSGGVETTYKMKSRLEEKMKAVLQNCSFLQQLKENLMSPCYVYLG